MSETSTEDESIARYRATRRDELSNHFATQDSDDLRWTLDFISDELAALEAKTTRYEQSERYLRTAQELARAELATRRGTRAV